MSICVCVCLISAPPTPPTSFLPLMCRPAPGCQAYAFKSGRRPRGPRLPEAFGGYRRELTLAPPATDPGELGGTVSPVKSM